MDATIIGIIIAASGIGVGVLFNIVNFIYKKNTDSDFYANQRETLARSVLREQEVKAHELKLETEALAKKVRIEMEEFVNRGTLDIRKDMAHNYTLIQDKFDIMKLTIEHISDGLINMQKAIDLLQQFYWGRDAKSVPPYIMGEDETKEHREQEGHGLFKDTEVEAAERKKN